MVVEAAPVVSIKETVSDWIQEEIERGVPLAKACEHAFDRIRKERLEAAVFNELGPRVLSNFWRHENHNKRAIALGRMVDEEEVSIPGERKVNNRRLIEASVMEQWEHVGGGTWKKIGDEMLADVDFVIAFSEKQEQGHGSKRRAYQKIRPRLKRAPEKAIRQVFTEKELKKIFDES